MRKRETCEFRGGRDQNRDGLDLIGLWEKSQAGMNLIAPIASQEADGALSGACDSTLQTVNATAVSIPCDHKKEGKKKSKERRKDLAHSVE